MSTWLLGGPGCCPGSIVIHRDGLSSHRRGAMPICWVCGNSINTARRDIFVTHAHIGACHAEESEFLTSDDDDEL